MTKIELVQRIGDMVCQDCVVNSDCGVEPKECEVITNACNLLDNYVMELKVDELITNACNLLDNYVMELKVDELIKEYLRKQNDKNRIF